jgi:HEAT repeat protein
MFTPPTPTRLRPAAWALVAVLAALAGAGRAAARPLPPDPVEEFRKALRLEQNPGYKGALEDNKAELERVLAFRRRNLKRAADNLKSLTDLSRALLLLEWRLADRGGLKGKPDITRSTFDEENSLLEAELRKELAKRFVADLKQATTRARPDRQVALANLVGETVGSAGNLGDDRLALYDDLSTLSDDLIRLTKLRNPQARAAAARALGQFPKLPGKVVPILAGLLKPSNPQVVRLGAAQGLSQLVQVVSGREPGRRSEPGVTVRETRPATATFTTEEIMGVTAPVVSAAAKALRDDSASVREAGVNALHQVTTTISERIPRQQTGTITDSPYPPPDRPWSEADRKLVQDARGEVRKLKDSLRPTLHAFRDSAGPIGRSLVDSDAGVRASARSVMEDLGRVSRLLKEYEASVPVERPARKDVHVPPPALSRPSLALRLPPAPSAAVGVEPGRAARPLPVLLVRRQKVEEKPIDPLDRLFTETAGDLASGLKDKDIEARRNAMDALEGAGEEAVPYIPQIVGALRDCDVFVAWVAARTLGKLAPRRADIAVPGLVPLLCAVDLDLRIATATALGSFGAAATSAVPYLAKAVDDGDSESRIAAMRGLEAIGTTAVPALSAIARQLTNLDPRVRAEAARVLGRFGSLALSYVPQLRKLNNDPDNEVRRAVSEAILLITGEE